MCGISGGIGVSAPSRILLQTQLESIKHRGPDDSGLFLADKISLGMCRLAVVEIASGKQPATDENENVRIVWNGEIYNFKELRSDLQKSGVIFRTNSESEVIIKLYLTHGLSFLEKLNGMFAIAIYDEREKCLHLIRDRIGKKPLWISQLDDGTLFFASEVRALMMARPDRTFRNEIISEIMEFGYINAPNSTFNEVTQLLPASVLTWKENKTSSFVYWRPEMEEKKVLPYPEALETTKEKIQSAISLRMSSERPLGAFLSGGIDSTIVTTLMTKEATRQVETYTIGFANQKYNEANHARRIAEYLGTNHHELILEPDPALLLEEISIVLDQPFADSSILPTYLLAKFARENLIVALGGDGGDEIFGGYDRYLAAPLMQKLNLFLPAARAVSNVIREEFFSNSKKFSRLTSQLNRQPTLAERYASISSLCKHDDLEEFLYISNNSANSKFVNDFKAGSISNYDRMIRSDIDNYLPGDLLLKADRATMANSLELRSPMLDINVVNWGLSLPKKYKIKGFETKHILKDLARNLVPSDLVDRPKMGFAIPRSEWLRCEMKDMSFDLLTDATARQRGWFKPKGVSKVLIEHSQGIDRDQIIWPMLMLELWARTWLD